MMRWTENETYKFVKIYLSHECLWNLRHPDYKMKDKRQQSYRRVAAEFKAATGIALNEPEVKLKLKSLKSTYAQEVSKIRRRSGPDYTFKPTIKWFPDWHRCLQQFSRKRLEHPTLDQQESQEDSGQKIWVDSHDVNEDEGQSDPFEAHDNNDEEYLSILKSDPDEAQNMEADRDNSYKIKRKKSYHRQSMDYRSRGSRNRSTDSYTESTSREDEFDIYGKYIASQLRKMETQRALRLQLEIQGLVSEARISEMSGN